MASPLYFSTKIFSEKVTQFVRIEKYIFNKISQLKEADREEIIEQLKESLKSLNKKEEEILYEMKKELAR